MRGVLCLVGLWLYYITTSRSLPSVTTRPGGIERLARLVGKVARYKQIQLNFGNLVYGLILRKMLSPDGQGQVLNNDQCAVLRYQLVVVSHIWSITQLKITSYLRVGHSSSLVLVFRYWQKSFINLLKS